MGCFVFWCANSESASKIFLSDTNFSQFCNYIVSKRRNSVKYSKRDPEKDGDADLCKKQFCQEDPDFLVNEISYKLNPADLNDLIHVLNL